MAKLNVVKINVCSSASHLDEIHLFPCPNSADTCYQLSDMASFGVSELISQTPTQVCTFSALESLDECRPTDLKFENMCLGKGMIKSLLNQTFLVSFPSPKFKCRPTPIVCVKDFKIKLSKKSICMDGYALSLFLYCLTTSGKYVDLVTNYLSHQCYIIYQLPKKGFEMGYSEFKINLKEPERHVMDLTWAKMACSKMEELRQLQYTMSWLSTLGGAFSALGEGQERCARAAGMISVEQLRIAMKLGDDIIIAQCKLYFSLSLIQRGHCRLAKKIIQDQYNTVRSGPVADKKTLNMCKGIWARLKYEKYLNRLEKPKQIQV